MYERIEFCTTVLMPHLSGTTCPPKLVGLALSAVAGCAVALATRGVLPPGAVCAAPFSMYHITGAFSYALLVPYVRGMGVVLRSPGVVPVLAAVAAHRVATVLFFPRRQGRRWSWRWPTASACQ